MSDSKSASNKRTQLNVTPYPDTLKLLERAVAKYGARHNSAKTATSAAAEILAQFAPLWLERLELADQALNQQLAELRHVANKRATGR